MKPVKVFAKIISTVLTCAFLVSILLTVPVFAAGSVYVDQTYVEIEEGSTVTVLFTAQNAAGSYTVASGGCASANGSGWLDNESVAIGIYGASVGEGSVTISYEFATYDEEELTDSITITVQVYKAENARTPEKGNEEETPVPQQEETPTEPEDTRPTVKIKKKQYIVLDDLKGIEIPEGFDKASSTYKGKDVKVIEYGDDLTLYVLQRKDNGDIVYKVLNDETGKFESPRLIRQNKIRYFLFDVPENEKAPAGYTRKEVQINDFDVFCYVPDDAEHADFCYVLALADGKESYYSYDTVQGSIQRSIDLEAASEADAKIKSLEEEYAAKQARLAKREKLQKILLLAAGVIILALIVVLIIVAVKKKSKGGNKKNDVEDLNDDGPEENTPSDDPEDMSDFETVEFDLEDLVNDIEEDSWKKLGFRDHDDKN